MGNDAQPTTSRRTPPSGTVGRNGPVDHGGGEKAGHVDAHSVIGCAKSFSLGATFANTDEVMELLREGEQ